MLRFVGPLGQRTADRFGTSSELVRRRWRPALAFERSAGVIGARRTAPTGSDP
jgi:hypothetical protein